jgi:diamine N-acetyltransferase
MLTIRPAVPSDAALVLQLVRELAAYEELSHEVVAAEADVERALFSENPKAFCDIAEWEGRPVGFALWFYNYSTFRGRHGIYLEDLYVRPEFRGKGIGKSLLKGLAKRAVERGLPRVEWAVLDWNQPAIGFYEGLGAKILPDWRVCRLTGEALEAMAA